MKPSENLYKLLKQFEGCKLKAYLDSAGIPTIGYGTIQYPDGHKVKLEDKITKDEADFFLKYEVLKKAGEVSLFLPDNLNQNQYDALISFAYNVGVQALRKSTLLKKVKANPNDPSIESAFMMWNKARVRGELKEVAGLTKRRQAESDLYFLT